MLLGREALFSVTWLRVGLGFQHWGAEQKFLFCSGPALSAKQRQAPGAAGPAGGLRRRAVGSSVEKGLALCLAQLCPAPSGPSICHSWKSEMSSQSVGPQTDVKTGFISF